MVQVKENWKKYNGNMLKVTLDLDATFGFVHQRCLNFFKPMHSLDKIAICAPRGITKSTTQRANSSKTFLNHSKTVAVKPPHLQFSVKSDTLIYDDFVLLIDDATFYRIATKEGYTQEQIESYLSEICIVPRTSWLDSLLGQLFYQKIIAKNLCKQDTYFFFKLIIRELLICMSGSKLPSVEAINANESMLSKVIEYVESHLLTNITIKEIANACGLSASSLNRVFAKGLQMTPQRYIIRRKMEIADELLRHSNKTISEISFLVGYENQSSFTKAYKKHFKSLPSISTENYTELQKA